jgi:hypothetical protein
MDDQAIISQDFHSLNDNLSPHMRQWSRRTVDLDHTHEGLCPITGDREYFDHISGFVHVVQAGWTDGAIGNIKTRYRGNVDSRSTNFDSSTIFFDQLSNDETTDVWCPISCRQVSFHNPAIALTVQCFICGEC